MTPNGTGITYPEIELSGVKYTLKFTRGAIQYGISKLGLRIADLKDPVRSFAAVCDFLHIIIGQQFGGTVQELSSMLIDENKTLEAGTKILEAVGKVFPPTPAQASATEQAQLQ